ncbi:unnamed protein product [Rotaria sp. Silwood1]|nr:unnamed protein product [Rotaria sp. Silwood1]
MISSEKAKIRDVTHLQTLIEAEEKKAEELQAFIDGKKKQLENLNEKLRFTSEELKHVTENGKALVERKYILKKNLQEMHSQLNTVEREYQNAHVKVQLQDEKVQNLRQKIDLLNARDAKLSSDVRHIEDKLEHKVRQIENNNRLMDDIKENISKTHKQQENTQKIIQIAKEDLSSIQIDIGKVDIQIVKNEQDFVEMCEKLRQVNEAFTGNEQIRKANYEKLEKLEKSITDLKIYHCNLQKDYQEKIDNLIQEKVKEHQQKRVSVAVEQVRRKI